MAGRAGRVGFHSRGRAIIISDTVFNREYLFNKYVLGKPEQFSSSYKDIDVKTWLIKLIGNVKKIPTELSLYKNDS